MDVNKLSNEIFIKNIENKFINEDTLNSPIKRLLSLNDRDISNHSLNVGLSLYGCINEISSNFSTYLNMEHDILSFHQQNYDYIMYINLKIDCFDESKIYGEKLQFFETFLKNISCIMFLLDLNNNEKDLYFNIIKSLIKKEICRQKQLELFETKEQFKNGVEIILSCLFNSYNELITEIIKSKNFGENFEDPLINLYYITVFELFNELNLNEKFNKMIIRDTLINIISKDDKIFRLELIRSIHDKTTFKNMKNKYFKENEYTKYIIFNYFFKYIK